MSRVIKFSLLSNQLGSEPVEIKRLNSFRTAEPLHEAEDPVEDTFHEAEQKAKTILARAEQQASDLLERTEAEAAAREKELRDKEAAIDLQMEEARNRASREGFEEGYQKGLEQAEKDYEEKLEEAKKILSMAHSQYRQKIIEAEPEIIQLSVEIAGKIVGQRLEYDENWTGFIHECLKQVKGEEDIKLFVSPKYYELTSSFTKDLASQLNSEIVVYPENSIDDHICMIETKYGQINASIDSQLDEVKKKLLDLIGDVHGH